MIPAGGKWMKKTKQQQHIVFEKWVVTVGDIPGRQKVLQVGVWIDLDGLRRVAWKAASNISRAAQDGCLHVEIHTMQDVTSELQHAVVMTRLKHKEEAR